MMATENMMIAGTEMMPLMRLPICSKTGSVSTMIRTGAAMCSSRSRVAPQRLMTASQSR